MLFFKFQELERKFSQTVAYGNMKKILNKKNEQIKELRKKLVKSLLRSVALYGAETCTLRRSEENLLEAIWKRMELVK